MQDRFKFRVWSKKYNKFIEDNRYPIGSDYQLIITQSGTLINLGLGDFEDDCEDSYSWATFKNYEQDCIVMQSTGLKDKNGKLIYEGDIINIWCKNLTKNQISEVKFCKERAAFTFDYFTDFGNIVPCTMDKTEIEVIGNIYENPELLED